MDTIIKTSKLCKISDEGKQKYASSKVVHLTGSIVGESENGKSWLINFAGFHNVYFLKKYVQILSNGN